MSPAVRDHWARASSSHRRAMQRNWVHGVEGGLTCGECGSRIARPAATPIRVLHALAGEETPPHGFNVAWLAILPKGVEARARALRSLALKKTDSKSVASAGSRAMRMTVSSEAHGAQRGFVAQQRPHCQHRDAHARIGGSPRRSHLGRGGIVHRDRPPLARAAGALSVRVASSRVARGCPSSGVFCVTAMDPVLRLVQTAFRQRSTGNGEGVRRRLGSRSALRADGG